jgi:hypothetical protein
LAFCTWVWLLDVFWSYGKLLKTKNAKKIHFLAKNAKKRQFSVLHSNAAMPSCVLQCCEKSFGSGRIARAHEGTEKHSGGFIRAASAKNST